MSNLNLHTDLANEAASRRAREAEAFAREKAALRAIASKRDSAADGERPRTHGGVRIRLVELFARAIGVAGDIATTSNSRSAGAHKPH